MFKMLEVIGGSPVSYSEAVKQAVNQMIESGEKVHFFEVIEQRGAVRNGALKEYQVKLKAAVEADKLTKGLKDSSDHFCPTCHQSAGDSGHMCVPELGRDKKCDWCGALIPDERHLCDGKVKELAYICNSCGRTAVKAEHLCKPEKIKK